ncbi:MAG: RDD family protein [Flavobacteriales bacterium]
MKPVSSLEKRLLAIIVDVIVLGAGGALLSHAAIADERGIVASILGHFYFILFHWLTGSTPGKYVARIQVVHSSTGARLSIAQAALRESPYVLLTLFDALQGVGFDLWPSWIAWASLSFFALDVIAAVADQRNRSLHDRLAKTVVVLRNQ